MRKCFALGLLGLFVCASCTAAQAPRRLQRVLFVGNSLTYVGNLPAVFSALARANGHAVRSYMVVSPGGTLSKRVADGSAARGLRDCRCSTMILQERGGDLFGLFGHRALVQSSQAIESLAKMGRSHGADVVLLGTYNSPGISHRLVVMEGTAAHDAGIPYIAVAELLWRLHHAYPSLKWLRKKEGGHPGKGLTLLDAILVYKQLYGDFPAAKSFVVHAPIYGVHTGLKPAPRRANSPPPAAGMAHTPKTISYSASVVDKVIAVLERQANNSRSSRPSSVMPSRQPSASERRLVVH